jgi:hypothetical protein
VSCNVENDVHFIKTITHFLSDSFFFLNSIRFVMRYIERFGHHSLQENTVFLARKLTTNYLSKPFKAKVV